MSRIPNGFLTDSRRIPNGFQADSEACPRAAASHQGWSKNDYRMGVVAQLTNGHSARRFSRISSSAPPWVTGYSKNRMYIKINLLGEQQQPPHRNPKNCRIPRFRVPVGKGCPGRTSPFYRASEKSDWKTVEFARKPLADRRVCSYLFGAKDNFYQLPMGFASSFRFGHRPFSATLALPSGVFGPVDSPPCR